MTDTLFADVSSYQVDVDARYPYQFFSFRSNDGTYRDAHFEANLVWAKAAANSGRLTGFIVYFVYEPNWQQTIATFKAMVGAPHPKMAVMIDVESWSGRISGDQSAGINGARENLIAWLGGNRKRVIGYGNASDLNGLWPRRGDVQVVLANYGANPPFPGKIAHQFASNYNVPPFGPCDINSADGLSPAQFAAALGLTTPPVAPGAWAPSLPYTDLEVALSLSPEVHAEINQIVANQLARYFAGQDQHQHVLETLVREALSDVVTEVAAIKAKVGA